jgi:membrane protease YdiL (CAAX protease family)
VLGLLLLRFGSLWVPIACHSLWNALTSFAFLGAQNLPGPQ